MGALLWVRFGLMVFVGQTAIVLDPNVNRAFKEEEAMASMASSYAANFRPVAGASNHHAGQDGTKGSGSQGGGGSQAQERLKGLKDLGLASGGSAAFYVEEAGCSLPGVPEFGRTTLLLLTHSNASLYDVETGQITGLLYSRNARFRGAVPTPRGLWLLASPIEKKRDELWLLGPGGAVANRLVVPSTYDAHDAVCTGDEFWVVDTFHGRVLKVATPSTDARNLTVLNAIDAWERGEHINQIGVSGKAQTRGHALVVGVHNRGQPSRLDVVPNPGLPKAAERMSSVSGVGKAAHGMALWKSKYLVHLDSAGSALSRSSGARERAQRRGD